MRLAWFALAAALAAGSGCARSADDRYADLYARMHPSVVFLEMRAPSDDPKAHGKIDDAYGTAFVVESGDWGTRFLTAAHVIDQASNLRATFGDAKHASDVRVVARDDKNDLALLEVRSVKNLPALELGDSDKIRPGQPVGVLGYPIPDAFQDEGLGTTASIYGGRVASLRKDAIELDAPIVPGESGGPVFTLDGKVVGVSESRFEEEHEIGFATPVGLVKPFLAAHRR